MLLAILAVLLLGHSVAAEIYVGQNPQNVNAVIKDANGNLVPVTGVADEIVIVDLNYGGEENSSGMTVDISVSPVNSSSSGSPEYPSSARYSSSLISAPSETGQVSNPPLSAAPVSLPPASSPSAPAPSVSTPPSNPLNSFGNIFGGLGSSRAPASVQSPFDNFKSHSQSSSALNSGSGFAAPQFPDQVPPTSTSPVSEYYNMVSNMNSGFPSANNAVGSSSVSNLNAFHNASPSFAHNVYPRNAQYDEFTSDGRPLTTFGTQTFINSYPSAYSSVSYSHNPYYNGYSSSNEVSHITFPNTWASGYPINPSLNGWPVSDSGVESAPSLTIESPAPASAPWPSALSNYDTSLGGFPETYDSSTPPSPPVILSSTNPSEPANILNNLIPNSVIIPVFPQNGEENYNFTIAGNGTIINTASSLSNSFLTPPISITFPTPSIPLNLPIPLQSFGSSSSFNGPIWDTFPAFNPFAKSSTPTTFTLPQISFQPTDNSIITALPSSGHTSDTANGSPDFESSQRPMYFNLPHKLPSLKPFKTTAPSLGYNTSIFSGPSSSGSEILTSSDSFTRTTSQVSVAPIKNISYNPLSATMTTTSSPYNGSGVGSDPSFSATGQELNTQSNPYIFSNTKKTTTAFADSSSSFTSIGPTFPGSNNSSLSFSSTKREFNTLYNPFTFSTTKKTKTTTKKNTKKESGIFNFFRPKPSSKPISTGFDSTSSGSASTRPLFSGSTTIGPSNSGLSFSSTEQEFNTPYNPFTFFSTKKPAKKKESGIFNFFRPKPSSKPISTGFDSTSSGSASTRPLFSGSTTTGPSNSGLSFSFTKPEFNTPYNPFTFFSTKKTAKKKESGIFNFFRPKTSLKPISTGFDGTSSGSASTRPLFSGSTTTEPSNSGLSNPFTFSSKKNPIKKKESGIFNFFRPKPSSKPISTGFDNTSSGSASTRPLFSGSTTTGPSNSGLSFSSTEQEFNTPFNAFPIVTTNKTKTTIKNPTTKNYSGVFSFFKQENSQKPLTTTGTSVEASEGTGSESEKPNKEYNQLGVFTTSTTPNLVTAGFGESALGTNSSSGFGFGSMGSVFESKKQNKKKLKPINFFISPTIPKSKTTTDLGTSSNLVSNPKVSKEKSKPFWGFNLFGNSESGSTAAKSSLSKSSKNSKPLFSNLFSPIVSKSNHASNNQQKFGLFNPTNTNPLPHVSQPPTLKDLFSGLPGLLSLKPHGKKKSNHYFDGTFIELGGSLGPVSGAQINTIPPVMNNTPTITSLPLMPTFSGSPENLTLSNILGSIPKFNGTFSSTSLWNSSIPILNKSSFSATPSSLQSFFNSLLRSSVMNLQPSSLPSLFSNMMDSFFNGNSSRFNLTRSTSPFMNIINAFSNGSSSIFDSMGTNGSLLSNLMTMPYKELEPNQDLPFLNSGNESASFNKFINSTLKTLVPSNMDLSSVNKMMSSFLNGNSSIINFTLPFSSKNNIDLKNILPFDFGNNSDYYDYPEHDEDYYNPLQSFSLPQTLATAFSKENSVSNLSTLNIPAIPSDISNVVNTLLTPGKNPTIPFIDLLDNVFGTNDTSSTTNLFSPEGLLNSLTYSNGPQALNSSFLDDDTPFSNGLKIISSLNSTGLFGNLSGLSALTQNRSSVINQPTKNYTNKDLQDIWKNITSSFQKLMNNVASKKTPSDIPQSIPQFSQPFLSAQSPLMGSSFLAVPSSASAVPALTQPSITSTDMLNHTTQPPSQPTFKTNSPQNETIPEPSFLTTSTFSQPSTNQSNSSKGTSIPFSPPTKAPGANPSSVSSGINSSSTWVTLVGCLIVTISQNNFLGLN